jgi:hypothetical protein
LLDLVEIVGGFGFLGLVLHFVWVAAQDKFAVFLLDVGGRGGFGDAEGCVGVWWQTAGHGGGGLCAEREKVAVVAMRVTDGRGE